MIAARYLVFVLTCVHAAGCSSGASAIATATSPPVAPAEPSPLPPPPAAARCGRAPLPRCPLQAWMHANLAAGIVNGTLTELAPDLRALAVLAPEGYAEWAPIAGRAAEAAAAGDVFHLRAECAACHNTYRPRYRAELRQRPLPPTMGGARP